MHRDSCTLHTDRILFCGELAELHMGFLVRTNLGVERVLTFLQGSQCSCSKSWHSHAWDIRHIFDIGGIEDWSQRVGTVC